MPIIKHIAALQVLLPLFGAVFAALISKVRVAQTIAVIVITINSAISLYGYCILNNDLHYNFGGWPLPIGIEYRLDYINQPIIVYLNFILLFCLIFARKLIFESCIKYIDTGKQHIFYALLLFAHTGYLGLVSTNDLFNLYVFIEISSLSTYVLMSQGNDRGAAIGAFDYLMLGSIGATLILVGIGFILTASASLNITDIHNILNTANDIKIVIAGIGFILVGSLLKIAFFPMYFWMRRAYLAAPAPVLVYLASISTIIGSYICIRFLYYVIDYTQFISIFSTVIRPLAIIAIILCSLYAYIGKTLREVVINGIVAQAGYVILLLVVNSNDLPKILLKFLFIDGMNKCALFLLIAYTEYAHTSQSARTIQPKHDNIWHKNIWYFTIGLILIFNCGLPPSPMFIAKLQILDLFLSHDRIIDFSIIIVGSIISLLYHYKILYLLFFNSKEPLIIAESYLGFYILLFFQYIILIIL